MNQPAASHPPVILHAGALGDLILTLQLAQRLPAFARAEGIEVYARCPLQAEFGRNPRYRFHDLERSDATMLYRSDLPASLAWRERLADRFVLSALAGVDSDPHRTLVTSGAAIVLSVDPALRDNTGRHAVDRWADQLAAQGHVARHCPRTTRTSVGIVRSSSPGRRLVIHPGSGGRAKCWPLPSFVAVAEAWRALGGSALLLVGEVERERWSSAELATPDLRACADRAELIEQLARADVYLGNDAGPTHLAAWLGLPTVAIFGPTDPATWRPLGPRVAVIQGDAGLDRWGLTPEQVLQTLSRFGG